MAIVRKTFMQSLTDVLQRYPHIKKMIQQQPMPSRLFDKLPPEFDSVFLHTKIYSDELRKILSSIKATDTAREEDDRHKEGPHFTKECHEERLKVWAKNIIADACRELLDTNNNVSYAFMHLVGRLHAKPTPQPIDLICSYFGTAFQFIMLNLMSNEIPEDPKVFIHKDVYEAMFSVIGEYRNMIELVMMDRLSNPQISYAYLPPKEENHTLTQRVRNMVRHSFSLYAGSPNEPQNKTVEQQEADNGLLKILWR